MRHAPRRPRGRRGCRLVLLLCLARARGRRVGAFVAASDLGGSGWLGRRLLRRGRLDRLFRWRGLRLGLDLGFGLDFGLGPRPAGLQCRLPASRPLSGQTMHWLTAARASQDRAVLGR